MHLFQVHRHFTPIHSSNIKAPPNSSEIALQWIKEAYTLIRPLPTIMSMSTSQWILSVNFAWCSRIGMLGI